MYPTQVAETRVYTGYICNNMVTYSYYLVTQFKQKADSYKPIKGYFYISSDSTGEIIIVGWSKEHRNADKKRVYLTRYISENDINTNVRINNTQYHVSRFSVSCYIGNSLITDDIYIYSNVRDQKLVEEIPFGQMGFVILHENFLGDYFLSN